MSALFLAVDAGNSKTVALVADADGVVIGRGRAGVGGIYGGATAADAVVQVCLAVRSALEVAGAGLADIRHAAFRLAGVDWDEDEGYWQRAIAVELPELRSCSVKNDGYSLLRCGDRSGLGVALTAGTGPAVAARGPSGVEFCASWWIHDMLGGRGLGNSAFAAMMAADLGLGPNTVLTERLLRLFDLHDPEAVLYAFTRRENRRPGSDKWRAARLVLQASDEGDRVAQDIVRSQALLFAGHARIAAAKVGFDHLVDPLTVVLGGSIFTSEFGALRNAVTEELRRDMTRARVRTATGSPLAGALLDALAEVGVSLEGEIWDRVVNAVHPLDFLLTS